MIDFAREPEDEPDPPGGKGPSYLSPTQENKLIAMALNPRKRFRLSRQVKRDMVETSAANMKNEDARVSNGAVANLIKMESLNQKDDHLERNRDSKHGHIENQQINIYLPDNGRGGELPPMVAPVIESLNGRNGHHD